VLGDRFHVLRKIAPGEETSVHHGVQRLHAAVQHLGKPGDLADIAHRETHLSEGARGTSGRHELPAKLGELGGEGDQAGLVGDGEQRAHRRGSGEGNTG
jgi:hypothetical protein